MGRYTGICISNKFPGKADDVGLRTNELRLFNMQACQ